MSDDVGHGLTLWLSSVTEATVEFLWRSDDEGIGSVSPVGNTVTRMDRCEDEDDRSERAGGEMKETSVHAESESGFRHDAGSFSEGGLLPEIENSLRGYSG